MLRGDGCARPLSGLRDGPVTTFLAAALARLDPLLPRPKDLGPAVLGTLVAALPVAAMRVYVAHDLSPMARWIDLWRVQYGDLEFWATTALVAALILKNLPSRLHGAGRFALHAFCTATMAASIAELAFLSVTGTRFDLDLLAVAWTDAPQVAPVVLSEVQAWHLGALVAGVTMCFSPMALRFGEGPSRWSRATILLALPIVWLEGVGRGQPARALRIAQASLLEGLYWDALDRIGEKTIPPEESELVPVTVSLTSETTAAGTTASGTTASGAAPSGSAPSRRPPNVVLVFLESVGYANTSLGTPALDTTPNLARLAASGLSAANHTTVVPHTSKSVVATLCGQVPWLVTDVTEARPGGLPGRCLPELLEAVGYRTAFFQTAHEEFERRSELLHRMGFDWFRSRDTLSRAGFQKVNYFGIEDDAMLDPGLHWSAASEQPFFATYLTLTSHHDYVVPTDFPRRATYPGVTGRRAKHLDSVRYVDRFVGELVARYEAAGLADNTLFVFQGDHGEGFGEHGRSQHDLVIWEEGLHVPLVLYGPGVLGARTGAIDGPRQVLDVVPTVLDVVGAKVDGGYLPGTSLLKDVPQARVVRHACWRTHRCLAERRGTEKFIDHYRDRSPQLFDLAADPREASDRVKTLSSNERAERVEGLRSWRARVQGRLEALAARERATLQRPDDAPALATFGGTLDVLGCDLPAQVIRNESLWVTCRFRLKEAMDSAWKVSVRAEGPFTAVDRDAPPLDGLLPTFKWTPGHAVTDTLRVRIPATARVGEIKVAIGWERYTGTRIPMDGGGEWFQIGTVPLVAPEWAGSTASSRAASVPVVPPAVEDEVPDAEDP